MDTYRAIVTKRDTRRFGPDPVSQTDLGRLLQAARMAGSAKNEQVNRMLVVTEAEQRKHLAECGKFADWVAAAPLVIVFVVPTEGGRPFDYGRMAQNVMVMANSLGLASCPMTFHDGDRARGVLGLPAELSAPMGVAVGQPVVAKGEDHESFPRIRIDDLVRHERWS